ncbi:amidohydrolase family protein [candidate division KSB1 bacterium]|nr:amidohydrolase family protein [candidate division KSB1 bacterium]
MKSILGLLFWVVLITANSTFSQNLLLKNGHIVNPATQEITNGHLVIQDEIIKYILKKAPETFEGEVIDLSGKWLIPSLNDMHTHSYGNAGPGRKTQFLSTAGTAKMMLYCGVTGFLDLFSAEDFIINLRNQQRTKGLPGADIYCAGPCFTCTDGHCTEYGVPTRVINSPEDARREVSELAEKNPDVIKLVYHTNGRMPTVNKETMEALIAAANEHKIKTVIHIGSWQDAEEAVLAGATALTHTMGKDIPDQLIKLLKEKNVFMIPTLTVYSGMLRISENPNFLKNDLLKNVTTETLLTAYQDTSLFETRAKHWLDRQKSREIILRNIKKLSQNGIRIMTGTDAGNLGTFQGYSVHTELALLVEAGLSPWQALAATSTVPGEFWGKSFGVQPGDEASLVVLSASPIEDIRNTEKIEMIIHHGKVVDREKLIAAQN